MFSRLPPALMYVILTFFIACWWYLAFYTPAAHSEPQITSSLNKRPTYPQKLSTFTRDQIHRALAGDWELITALITTWDVDAQLLIANDLANIERLPKEQFLEAQRLGRILVNSSESEILHLNEAARWPVIFDDLGVAHKLATPHFSFFPQTYMAASFLLALNHPSQIRAIPKGLREQKQLYREELLQRVAHDVDGYHTELFYQDPPDIAFVAHYSIPTTLQTLKDQEIPLVTFKNIDSIDNIYYALERVGHVVNAPLAARLLHIFMQAALLNMNNRLKISSGNAPNTLYVRYHGHFSTPQKSTLIGEMLDKLHINDSLPTYQEAGSTIRWNAPLTFEQLMSIDPDLLIVCSAPGVKTTDLLFNQPAIDSLKCYKNQNIYFVDENIQDSPSQYLVLAYYDLYKILEHNSQP